MKKNIEENKSTKVSEYQLKTTISEWNSIFNLWTGRQSSCLISVVEQCQSSLSSCFKQFKCKRNHVRQFTQTLTIIFPNDKRKLLNNENEWGPMHQIKRKMKKINIKGSKSTRVCINYQLQVINEIQLSITNWFVSRLKGKWRKPIGKENSLKQKLQLIYNIEISNAILRRYLSLFIGFVSHVFCIASHSFAALTRELSS